MDFTPELQGFQGVIISADNVHPFSELTAKGGNEEKIEYVINCLVKFLKDGNYINENGIANNAIKNVRKFALYIVLNSDLPFLGQMVDMDGVGSLIWTIPTVPHCLMCEIFWKLGLDNIMYEVISFSYPQIAIEVAATFVNSIKYFNPTECIAKLKLLSAACYRLVCRLDLYNFESNIIYTVLQTADKIFQKCLKYFVEPPRADKLNELRKNALYKYKGHNLHSMFLLINDCIKHFTEVPQLNPVDEIYLTTNKEGKLRTEPLDFLASNTPNNNIRECLNNFNGYLLEKCQQLVMDVSVDIFCAWSEFEENGKSMQQTIGEACDRLRTSLLNINSLSEHPVVGMIQQIARKPVDVVDIINDTDNDTIIENINKNNEETATWVHALVTKEGLCKHVALIECLLSHLHILSEDECQNLYKVFNSYLNTTNDNNENVTLLFTKFFQLCTTKVKLDILEQHFNNSCFKDLTPALDFENMLTEIFNKLIASTDTEVTDVLNVFLQNPHQVYKKIFILSTENEQQKDIMLKVMTLLEKFSNHYYNTDTEPCIIRVTKEILDTLDTDVKQNNFVKFITGLKHLSIIPDTKLLLLIVMPNLHKGLINTDYSCIKVQIQILMEAYEMEEFTQYRAPILAMLAQVHAKVRWQFHTYNPIAPSTLEMTIKLQEALISKYEGQVPENEKNWLKSKLMRIEDSNNYYSTWLWDIEGRDYIEIASGIPTDLDTDVDQLTTWIAQEICSSILAEWYHIWDSLKDFGDPGALNIFYDAMVLLIGAEEANHQESTWGCLMFCYKNFSLLLRYKFLKSPLTDRQVSAVIIKIANLINMMKEENIEEVGTFFVPLLGYMVEKKDEYTMDISNYFRTKIKYTKFLDMIDKMFTNRSV